VPLLPADCAETSAPYVEGRCTFSATTPCRARSRASGIGTLARNPFSSRSYPSPDPARPRGGHRRERPTPGGRRAEGLGREAVSRGGPDHFPPESCHRPAPARQCSHLPQGQGGTEEPGERRLVWADGRGLLPDGVRHMGMPPWGREGGREGDLRKMLRLPPPRRPPRGGRRTKVGPQRATAPLSGPAAGGPTDGGDGDADIVVLIMESGTCLGARPSISPLAVFSPSDPRVGVTTITSPRPG